MKITTADEILGPLEGATIVSYSVDDEEGMHIVLADGRVLIVAGVFALSVLPADKERLH